MNMFSKLQGRPRIPSSLPPGSPSGAMFVTIAAIACAGCGAAESVTTEERKAPAVVSTANVCPAFGWWILLPRSLRLGETTDILVNVTDPDTPRSKLKLDWAATTGTFSELHRADTAYTCRHLGNQVLTLDARDDFDCVSVLQLDVTCLDP